MNRWEEFLEFSIEYSNKKKLEIEIKDDTRFSICISRAYYAVFNLARNYIENDLSMKLPDNNVHSDLRKAFLKESQIVRQTDEFKQNNLSIEQDLGRLHRLRKLADYDMNKRMSATELKQALDLVDSIYSALSELKPK